MFSRSKRPRHVSDGPRSARRFHDPDVGIEPVDPRRGAYKDRVMSSSVFANSEGQRAGNPKHSFPSSMAGSQKQPFSTGKQRNAVTGRPAKPTSRPKTDPSGRCALLSTRLTGCELNRSEAARILAAKWHRNPHWCSRSVKTCAPCKYGPIKSTSLPESVIVASQILAAHRLLSRMEAGNDFSWSLSFLTK